MSYCMPEKLFNLTPYAPWEGEAQIHLDANESPFAPPEWLREEIGNTVKEIAFNRYPDPYCVALCEKAAAFWGVAPSNLVAGNGSDELIGLILSWFTQPGDTAVVVSPDFSMYSFYAQACGVQVKSFPKAQDRLDVEALADFVREQGARVLVFSNPCNPTSLQASRQQVLQLIQALPDQLVVVDEAYMDFSDASILQDAPQYDHLVLLKTCSKAMGMAAIRLGFAICHPTLAIALKAAKSPYNVNTMTQAVGEVLFSHPDYLREQALRIRENRDQLYRAVVQLAEQKQELLAVYPTSTNYLYCVLQDARRVFSALTQRGIAVRLLGDRLRICTGTEQENRVLLDALQAILH